LECLRAEDPRQLFQAGLGDRGLAHRRSLVRSHAKEAEQPTTENIALYSRLGYVETHRAEEKGYSRIYMEKRLLERSRPI